MTISISFDCRDCGKPATVIEGDGIVRCVYCPACGRAVDAGAVPDMLTTLLERYRRRLARNPSGRKGRRLGNRFTDGRWPFVMTIAEQGGERAGAQNAFSRHRVRVTRPFVD